MNKKQAGIIVTLLALIICAGILATKVNGPLEVNSGFDSSSGVLSFNKDNTTDKSTNKTTSKTTSKTTNTDYFNTARPQKEQNYATTLADLKSIVDDKNVSEEQRNSAAKKFENLTTSQNNEEKIEQVLKGKGFDDVLCFIDTDKVRIIVKAKEISSQQNKQIQDVVYSVTKLTNVEVELKE